MKIQSLVAVLFLFSSLLAQGDTTLQIKDFDQDGSLDTLRSWYSGGSGGGGRYVELVEGRNQRKFEYNSCGSFGNFINIIPFSEEVYDEYYQFLEPILQTLIGGGDITDEPDPTINWLGSANAFLNTNKAQLQSTSHPYFDRQIGSYETWEIDELIRPAISASLGIHPDLPGLMHQFAIDTTGLTAESYSFFLLYYGQNHFNLKTSDFAPAASNDNYSLLTTAHGVVAQRPNGEYKWIFISQPGITGAPAKLRWNSIGQVDLAGDFAIVQQHFPVMTERWLWIVHIPSGRLGRLKEEIYSFQYDEGNGGYLAIPYTIESELLFIGDEATEQTVINLKRLFE